MKGLRSQVHNSELEQWELELTESVSGEHSASGLEQLELEQHGSVLGKLSVGKDQEEWMAAEILHCAMEELSEEINNGVQNINCVWVMMLKMITT